MNIKFSYLYRDGANYKNFNEIVFSNPSLIDSKEIETTIRNKLIDGKWFVCNEWKLPDMHFKEFNYDPKIDHDRHEFQGIEETIEKATEESTIDEFLFLVNKTKLPWRFYLVNGNSESARMRPFDKFWVNCTEA